MNEAHMSQQHDTSHQMPDQLLACYVTLAVLVQQIQYPGAFGITSQRRRSMEPIVYEVDAWCMRQPASLEGYDSGPHNAHE